MNPSWSFSPALAFWKTTSPRLVLDSRPASRTMFTGPAAAAPTASRVTTRPLAAATLELTVARMAVEPMTSLMMNSSTSTTRSTKDVARRRKAPRPPYLEVCVIVKGRKVRVGKDGEEQ